VLFAAPPVDRYDQVPQATMTLAHRRLAPAQGGQRLRVTIPATALVTALGDRIAYRWDTEDDARCRPGALPDLGGATAGTVIDAPLAKPAKGWCRGEYFVRLTALVTVDCTTDPSGDCEPGATAERTVARATFRVGSAPTRICHRLGEVERCWDAPTHRDRGGWVVTAPLDDLLGPDGATADADRYINRAFRGDRELAADWETDDDTFWGYPRSRAEAVRMTAVVDRMLRAGPYHGKRWPGRPTRSPDTAR
jgi:hypothetical protein